MFVEHCGDDTTFTKELVFRTRVNICQMEKVKLLSLFFFFSSNGVDRNLNMLLSFMIVSQGILMLH